MTSPFDFELGDVRAVATRLDEDVFFKISSHAVCCASLVWKKALLLPLLTPEDTDGSESQDETLAEEERDGGEKSLEEARETLNDEQPHPGEEELQDEVSSQVMKLNIDDEPQAKKDSQHASSQGCPGVQDKILDLRGDDFETVMLLLRIAHLQFNKIPLSLPFETLFKVAELCDYYDCVKLVGPWLPRWLESEEMESRGIGLEKRLFIAWVFGREKVFESLAMKMVREVTTDDEGNCLNSEREVIPLGLPHGSIEHILVVRSQVIGALLDVPYSFVDRYESSKDMICRHHSKHSAKQCDSMIYGSLVISLRQIGLWPRKKPSDVHINIVDLKNNLASVEILSQPPDIYFKRGHIKCGGNHDLKDQLSRVLSHFPNPVLASHRRHMEIQNKLLEIRMSEG